MVSSQRMGQCILLISKRFTETFRRYEILQIFSLPLMIFGLISLLYLGELDQVFISFFDGPIEAFLVPISSWFFAHRLVIMLVHDKVSNFKGHLEIMNMRNISYWMSYFIFEGMIIGCSIALLCSVLSLRGLFNGAAFTSYLCLLVCYYVSIVPFCFFLSTFFDNLEVASVCTFAVLIGK